MKLPSLYSPERSEGDGWCWANLQNTHFSGLTRKNPAFERSVLKYVSIKIPVLTHSGRKRRVCVNQPDRLTHPAKTLPYFCLFLPDFLLFLPFLTPSTPPSKAGRCVAFLKLAGAHAEAMDGVGLICKIRVLRPEKEAPGF